MSETHTKNPRRAKCPTCCRPAGAPYRRCAPNGKVTEGCVDEFHTGAKLLGESSAWHSSPEAREIRRRTAERLSALVGEPMRGDGLPGKLDRSNRRSNPNRPVR